MIANFEDFVTWMFVMIDDVWQSIAPLYNRPGPDPRTCSDSELITIAIVSACRGWHKETELRTNWMPYRHLFPKFPERSRFNRRRRNLMYAINQVRQIVLQALDVAQDAHGAIDSLPIPVITFHLAPQRTHDWDANGATFGHCASKKQTFFGYRLHLVITLGGVILNFELTSANADERDAAMDMLPQHPGLTVLADKGYVNAELEQQLAEKAEVNLIALRRANQHEQLPEEITRLNTRFRQMIETVNGQLVEQFGIQSNGAHSFWGLCARLHTKLAAHTICIALNRKIGNPNFLQIKGLAFPN